MAAVTFTVNAVDTPATSASGSAVLKTAGESLAQYDFLYTDVDGTVKKCVNTSQAAATVTHMALAGCASGKSAKCLTITTGVTIQDTGAFVADTTYYVSSTAGKIETAADLSPSDFVFAVGTCVTADEMVCHPTYIGQT